MDVKKVVERVKTEIQRRMGQLAKLQLNDKNLMKAINCRVIPVAVYVMNVCNLRKNEVERLDRIMKKTLWREGYHGRQAGDKRLYMMRDMGGRGWKSFNDVYKETKVRIACYMSQSKNEWIKAAWENEVRKEQTSVKKEADEAMLSAGEKVEFEIGYVQWKETRYENWKETWKRLKGRLEEGTQAERRRSLESKKLQSKVFKAQGKEDHSWLRCNTDPRKTAAIFNMREQMIETRTWKEKRGIGEEENCRLCRTQKETVHHLVAGCTKLAGSEYTRRHNNALMVLAVEWGNSRRIVTKRNEMV